MLIRITKRSLYSAGILFLAMVFTVAGFYLIQIRRINSKYQSIDEQQPPVALRKFPFPYKAALAISSDIDQTQTLEEFTEIQKFLTTRELTPMGAGIGLEFANSFFFYEPPSEAISYFQAGPEVAEAIRKSITAGTVDTIHSFGKKADFKRQDAIAALQEMNKYDFNLEVWIDHTQSTDNLGDDVTFGRGDHPRADEYHSDLTIKYGIKFVWLGRVTMITGQAVPIDVRTFLNIYDSKHPLRSLVNMIKELTKNFLAVVGNKKYALHKENDLIRIAEMDDGLKVYEFIRFDNYWRGVSTGANNRNLANVISYRTLRRLKQTGGYMIVYTHLGMNSDCTEFICQDTRTALRNLAKENKDGNILVSTTSKILNYYITYNFLNWTYRQQDGVTYIQIHDIADPIYGAHVPTVNELSGFTFYVPDNERVKVYIDKIEVKTIKKNPPDHIKRESITISPDTA